MARITIRQLENLVERLNKKTNSPLTSYTRTSDGQLKPNANHYYIAQAYGGTKLEQMCQGGGSHNPLSMGFVSKRECFQLVDAYLRGMEDSQ
tara:strand:- start:193 stop:468 length:276 start_codon:yes stop_codon:yes gene_type:complete